MRNAFDLSYSYSVELHRSSHQRCSKTNGVLNIFAKFTGKHLSQILFFNKVAGIRPVTSLKERLWSRRFFMNFAKLRTPILKTICERLLAAGWRTTQKLNRRDLLLLRCLVYINISVASSFPFFYLRFLYTYLKLNLQTKNYVENFGRFQNLTSKNKTKFSGCPDEYGHGHVEYGIWSCGICRLRFFTYWVILTMTQTGYNMRTANPGCSYTISERFSQVINN